MTPEIWPELIEKNFCPDTPGPVRSQFQAVPTGAGLERGLDSTDFAILFLDTELKVRFFTLATMLFFNVVEGDIGRPFANLLTPAKDHRFEADAREVLRGCAAAERDVKTATGWWTRRIVPVRSQEGVVDGVVVMLSDITERIRGEEALQQLAKRDTERANLATFRFLAAIGHDLQRPFPTLSIQHGLVATRAAGAHPKEFVDDLGGMMGGTSAILDALLDGNGTKKGFTPPEIQESSMDAIPGQLSGELAGVAPSERTLALSEAWPVSQAPSHDPDQGVVYLVYEDGTGRTAVRALLEDSGLTVHDFGSAEAFQAARRHNGGGCLLIDALLPGMGGIDLVRQLRSAGDRLPAIMMTGLSDVPLAVKAIRAGATDLIAKPIAGPDLIDRIRRALEQSRDASRHWDGRENARRRLAELTPRQRSIMDLVLAGLPSKNIAADLGISQRTVETHRAAIMKRTSVRSLPALARLAAAASATCASAINLPEQRRAACASRQVAAKDGSLSPCAWPQA